MLAKNPAFLESCIGAASAGLAAVVSAVGNGARNEALLAGKCPNRR
jgi:hypothetical protein